jgi:Transglycosylase-like domain
LSFNSVVCRTRRQPTVAGSLPVPVLDPGETAVRRSRKTGRRLLGLLAAAVITSLSIGSMVAATPGRAQAAWPTGQGVVLKAPVVDVAATPTGNGYWIVGADGGIFALGDAQYYGSASSLPLARPIVGMASTPDGRGYWLVASDGGVFAFGDAGFYGSTGSLGLAQPVVGLEPTADGHGYWIVAADGGVFAFGDAGYFGSAVGRSPGSPIVGLAPAPGDQGYWEAAADGSVFAFGRAGYAGGTNGLATAAIGADGSGYRLLLTDGGVFTFGGASFLGSAAAVPLNKQMIALTSSAGGYLALAADGGVFAFGADGYYGSLADSTVAPPVAANSAANDYGLTPSQIAQWERVNVCEEGGRWDVEAGDFGGGLGFTRANWEQFNTFGFPSDAADATPMQQIRVAVAFAAAYLGGPFAAPDQDGCAGY